MKIKTRRYYYYYLLITAAYITALLPIRMVWLLGRFAGRLMFRFAGKYRNTTVNQLKDAFPEKSETEIYAIARSVFANVASNFAMFSQIYKLNARNIDLWVNPGNVKRIDEALAKGKGAIALTAHFGHWELLGAYVMIKGYPGITIVKNLYFHKFHSLINRLRTVHGLGQIDRQESPKKILRALRDNSLLGILPDQDIDSIEGIFVDFFGKPAYTPVAPIRIARISGAPLLPCYVLWTGERYEFIVDEPIYVDPDMDKTEADKYYTQRWTKVLESYIIKYPDQWVWMHRRWKTQKKDP